MHDSVMEFIYTEISEKDIFGVHVLEVGSQDINGSPRETLLSYRPASYIGVDSSPGKGVDLVVPADNLLGSFGADRFGFVISTEMLEHAKDWRAPVHQMKSVLKPGGVLMLTTRSPGFPWHGFPEDHWRFTTNLIAIMFADMDIIVLRTDPMETHPGVFLKAKKRVNCPMVDLSKIEAYPI